MSASAHATRRRQVISLDLPPEQVEWLDRQAAGLMSRSAFARTLIARAMQASDDAGNDG